MNQKRKKANTDISRTQPFAVWLGTNNPTTDEVMSDLHLRYHLLGYSSYQAKQLRKTQSPLVYYKNVLTKFNNCSAVVVQDGVVMPLDAREYDEVAKRFKRTYKAKYYLKG